MTETKRISRFAVTTAAIVLVLAGCGSGPVIDGMKPEPEDTAPVFSDATTDQTYTVGMAIQSLTLPEATGGDGTLTYSLGPMIPDGLMFDGATRTLSGTPTTAGTYHMTYTVADADDNSDDTDSEDFTITVQDPEDDGHAQATIGPGTYRVGQDIQPGTYAGRAGTGPLESCYWARLMAASGELSDIIANDNARGQFYVEIAETDGYFEVACAVTSLEDWPGPEQPLSKIGPGTYLVGRDLSPGTFRGTAGDDILDSCYWARLRGVSGTLADIIANDNAIGRFFVEVAQTDYALKSGCALERVE